MTPPRPYHDSPCHYSRGLMWLLGVLLPLMLALSAWFNGRLEGAEAWQLSAERQLSEIRTDVRWIREALARQSP